MTASELKLVVEGLPDDMNVEWGCFDTSIPKKVYRCHDAPLSTFKQFLNECDEWKEVGNDYKGRVVTVVTYLVDRIENTIIFYMGYTDEEN